MNFKYSAIENQVILSIKTPSIWSINDFALKSTPNSKPLLGPPLSEKFTTRPKNSNWNNFILYSSETPSKKVQPTPDLNLFKTQCPKHPNSLMMKSSEHP